VEVAIAEYLASINKSLQVCPSGINGQFKERSAELKKCCAQCYRRERFNYHDYIRKRSGAVCPGSRATALFCGAGTVLFDESPKSIRALRAPQA
jgi:hypothetical protein